MLAETALSQLHLAARQRSTNCRDGLLVGWELCGAAAHWL